MKHTYFEPRADIRFLKSEDIIAASPTDSPVDAEKVPGDDTVEDNF